MPTYSGSNYFGATTVGSTAQLNSAPMGVQQLYSGGYDEVLIDAQGKYSIDIFADMKTFEAPVTPLLTLVTNMGQESISTPVITWTDRYDGDAWVDIALDDLRLRSTYNTGLTLSVGGYNANESLTGRVNHTIATSPYAIDNDLQKGGKLELRAGVLPTAVSDGVVNGSAYVAPVNSGKVVFTFTNSGVNIIGNTYTVAMKLHNLLVNSGYTLDTTTYGSTKSYVKATYSDSAKVPIYLAFETMTYATDWTSTALTELEDNEIIAKLHSFTFANDYSQLFFEVDFGVSNLDASWSTTATTKSVSALAVADNVATATATAHGFAVGDQVVIAGCTGDRAALLNSGTDVVNYVASVPTDNTFTFYTSAADEAEVGGTITAAVIKGNKLLLEEVANGASEFEYGATRISRLALIGTPLNAPAGVPEGDRLGSVGGYVSHGEVKENFIQIFTSDKYGITGTAMATNFRFGDGMAETRARHLRMFKGKQEAAMLRGVKSLNYAVSDDAFVNGKPVRTTSGLFDYAMFPIKYFDAGNMPSAVTASSSGINGVAFKAWLDNLIHKTKAFRQKSANALTYLVSQDFLSYIHNQVAMIGSHTGGNVTGVIFTKTPGTELSMYLESWDYESPYGTVKFVHEPAFDTMPTLPVPQFIFGSNVNPRRLLLAVDPANMKRVTLRSDQILGNIQESDRDGFMEGMRGEHGFKFRFPKNFTVIKY